MAKAVLSKSGLQKERENLRLYRKVLPSLDLKRRQLLGERRRAEIEAEKVREEYEGFAEDVIRQLPMLGAGVVDISELLKIKSIDRGLENLVGVKVPVLRGVEFEIADYPLLGKPHWVDLAIKRLQEYAERKLRYDLALERVECIREAARKITQRVNLFERILIPGAEENIKKIQIYLADAERAAVVQSKIAKTKSKRLRQAAALAEQEGEE